MKKVLLLSVILTLLLVSVTVAQSVMTIEASDGFLNEVIEADRNPDGTQMHDVYQLVTLDQVYQFSETITQTAGEIHLEGVVDPADNRPPCIQPAVL